MTGWLSGPQAYLATGSVGCLLRCKIDDKYRGVCVCVCVLGWLVRQSVGLLLDLFFASSKLCYSTYWLVVVETE